MNNRLHSIRVRSNRLLRTVTLIGLLAGTAAALPAAELLAGIAPKDRLVLFSSADPEDAAVVQLRGLQPGEVLLGIDVRPATGELYGLGSSSRLYTIDIVSGKATAIGTAPFTPALSGTSFGFDFNPTVDRIRVVSDAGQNLRLHPVTGAVAATDTNLVYAATDAGAGTTPAAAAAAYTNNDNDPATGTMLFDIDAARGVLVLQSPPNNGVLSTIGSLGVGMTTTTLGFDVAGSDGTAYAALLLEGEKRAGLYTIDLITGAATWVGRIGGPKPLMSLATLGQID